MHHETGQITGADGTPLFTRSWQPIEREKAAVLLAHGVHEHSGRYAYLAGQLLLSNIALFAYDHRGHGQSGGEQSMIDSFDDYVLDLKQALAWVGESSRAPLFLMGHSMGGLVVARYITDFGDDGFAGVILSSPALRLANPPSSLLRKAAQFASRHVPRLPVTRVDLSRLSHEPWVERTYRNDPLCIVGGLRARTAYELLLATQHVDASRFQVPTYVFHGSADTTTDPQGSKDFAENVPDEVTLRIYDGLYHETLNETERDRVIEDLSDWILQHSQVTEL